MSTIIFIDFWEICDIMGVFKWKVENGKVKVRSDKI